MAQPALLGGVGLFNNGLDASCEAIVVDHEITGMLLHGLRGIEVNAETLGLQAVADVLNGGAFLTHPHTLRHLRDGERWSGRVTENDSFDEWIAAGRRTVADCANEQARALLAAHQVPALDPAAEEHLQAVLVEAQQQSGAAGSGPRRLSPDREETRR
jgi:trimethylamine--corrinoid protein Co-methyltransferase